MNTDIHRLLDEAFQGIDMTPDAQDLKEEVRANLVARVDERELWPSYMAAYQTVFERTSTDHAPWHVVPADRKWYARLAVQHLLLEALEEIDPHWPLATFDVEAEKKRLAAS